MSLQSKLLYNCWNFLCSINFFTHIILSIILRFILIIYGQIHDNHSDVPYTDIDYKVVTDGARHILKGESPFNRHTYRYSPLMAILQLPNIWLNPSVGKIIFSIFDIFVALLIYALVRHELQLQCYKAVQSFLCKIGKLRHIQYADHTDERNRPESIAKASACFWLYNPLTAIISTRGNGDSFSSFFVILTIYLIVKSESYFAQQKHTKLLIFFAGLSHGFAIHLRLYPLLFSLAYYLSLSDSLIRSVRSFFRQLLFPSTKQLTLIFGTFVSFIIFTGYFYYIYGYQYIYETYLYHFVRKDVRHNFSFYFLMQYLGANSMQSILYEKLLIILPQLLLIFYISIYFGQFKQNLPFCIFALAFIMVTYNSVVTSQYFVWYLALLPLCLNNLQSLKVKNSIILCTLWLLGQALWLLPAYLLEYKTWNTFYWIGCQGILFFILNTYILINLIENYSFTSFKINFKKYF